MQEYSDRTLKCSRRASGERAPSLAIVRRSRGNQRLTTQLAWESHKACDATRETMSRSSPRPLTEDDTLGLAYTRHRRGTSSGVALSEDAGPRHGSRTMRPTSSRPQSGSMLLAGSQQAMPPPIGVRCVRASGTADAVPRCRNVSRCTRTLSLTPRACDVPVHNDVSRSTIVWPVFDSHGFCHDNTTKKRILRRRMQNHFNSYQLRWRPCTSRESTLTASNALWTLIFYSIKP